MSVGLMAAGSMDDTAVVGSWWSRLRHVVREDGRAGYVGGEGGWRGDGCGRGSKGRGDMVKQIR